MDTITQVVTFAGSSIVFIGIGFVIGSTIRKYEDRKGV